MAKHRIRRHPKFSELAHLYTEHQVAQGHLARSYYILETWCGRFGERSPSSMTRDEIAASGRQFRETRGWRDSTHTLALNVLSGFFDWLEERGLIQGNPCRRIPRKSGNALRNLRTFVPTPAQFQAFLRELEQERFVRDAVVVAASTGLRFSKIAGLRHQDLHHDGDGSWFLKVWDKNGEIHAAPLFGQALGVVLRRASEPGVWLLPGPKGGKLRPKYVIPRLKKACSMSGLKYSGRDLDGFSFHTLRKLFATTLFNAGADIRTVQVAGNWKSITVVERYARLSDKRKKAAFETVALALTGSADQDTE